MPLWKRFNPFAQLQVLKFKSKKKVKRNYIFDIDETHTLIAKNKKMKLSQDDLNWLGDAEEHMDNF